MSYLFLIGYYLLMKQNRIVKKYHLNEYELDNEQEISQNIGCHNFDFLLYASPFYKF